ncbi:MAG: DEAD/DEAH box helicase, partial [Deltaproteobacteria bacterium]|nr:DEAD/DEAH box helicase [Deltaproteobacteria bacterium]
MGAPNQENHRQTDTPSEFESLGLALPLLRGLAKNGFKTPTEVQFKSIPVALQGRDVLASAQTGTGKTAAFVLPCLQKLLTPATREGRGPRVLVLTPTRELAGQVEVVIRQMGRFTSLRSGMVVGGMSYGPQERMLRNGVDLLVATPGRLMDHMERGLVDFSRVELFVLDEADRMLDMGFVKPVRQIAAALPKVRQTLLFSATLEGQVMSIAKSLLNDPERIHLSPARQRNMAITQHLHRVKGPEHKQAVLSHFLTDPQMNQAIVFTATKRGADKLTKRLNSTGIASASLHGNMRQKAREQTVDLLRRGKIQILVATDVAARGIDVEGITHVINFDLPQVAEDYIH